MKQGWFLQLWKKLKQWRSPHRERLEYYNKKAEDATTYEEWRDAAGKLDMLEGKDLWRKNPVSRHYDLSR